MIRMDDRRGPTGLEDTAIADEAVTGIPPCAFVFLFDKCKSVDEVVTLRMKMFIRDKIISVSHCKSCIFWWLVGLIFSLPHSSTSGFDRCTVGGPFISVMERCLARTDYQSHRLASLMKR